MRDELLGVELFSSLTEAQAMVADWRHDYNHHRPHSSLQMLAPARFAQSWREDLETAQPITLADPAEAPRTPQNGSTSAPEDRIDPDRADERPPAVAAVALRSPSGLAARDDTATYDATPTDHRLSLQVDR